MPREKAAGGNAAPSPHLTDSFLHNILPSVLTDSVRSGECVASPCPGKDQCAAVEKNYLQLFSSVGGLA